MQEGSGYARRFIERQHKDRASGYSSKVGQITLSGQPKMREPLALQEKSSDSKLRTTENSASNIRVETLSRSSHTIVPAKKEHRKQLSKPVVDSRNLSNQAKYSTRRHSRLGSEVTTASTTLRKQQQQTISKENIELRRTEKDEPTGLMAVFRRVNAVLEEYRRKEQQWKKDKQTYENKIELLVNQLARTERLR